MRTKVLLGSLMAGAILAAFLAVRLTSQRSYISAVKIVDEINRLHRIRDAGFCWAKLQHNQVGTIKVATRSYPVYYDKRQGAVYVSVRDGSRKPDYIRDQSAIDSELSKHAAHLGINTTLNYNLNSSQEILKLMVHKRSSRYDAKIEKCERQFRDAIRQVEHKPFVSNGQHHRVLSDPSCQFFVVISPFSSDGPKDSDRDAYLSKIAAAKGVTYREVYCEHEPERWKWLKRMRPRFVP